MDALRQEFAANPAVTVKEIEKPFYRDYLYRITVDLERFGAQNETARRRRESYHDSQRWAIGLDWASSLCDALPTGSWRCTSHWGCGSFYFRTEADALSFARQCPDAVDNIAGPSSPEAMDVMLSDTKVRVRNMLFWSRYRWCVVLNPWGGLKLQARLVEWSREFAEAIGGGAKLRSRAMMSLGAWQSRVYFAHETDVMVFKMVFSSDIAKIEKAVLKEELKT